MFYDSFSEDMERQNCMPYMQPMMMPGYCNCPKAGAAAPGYMQEPFGMQPIVQMPMEAEGNQPQTQMPMQNMQAPMMQDEFPSMPSPVTNDISYTQAYLKTKIGAKVKIEFLIGTNMLVDREGTLLEVGISYLIIREVETDDNLLCDIYSIKFVRFYM